MNNLALFLSMPSSRPFVTVAAVCEQVLVEKDNVMSAIRLVDTYYIETEGKIPEGLEPGLQLNLLLSVKSGDVTGESKLGLSIRSPSGKTKAVGTWPIILKGGEHGANLHVKLVVPANEIGLFWFDVSWEGEPLTSVPLRLASGPKPNEGAVLPEKN